MPVCVDTSVWIAAFRHPREALAARLRQLLDNDEVLLPVPVRLEILAGVGARAQKRLRLSLSALPLAVPGEATWTLIEEWIGLAAAAGERFGFADLLIASLAAEQGAMIWSLDSDFSRMARLGFIVMVEARE